MDEAQDLADRVIVIAGGRIIAEGTPESLGGRESAHTLTGWAIERGEDLDGMTVTRPSLEDIYLELTDGDTSPADAQRDAQ